MYRDDSGIGMLLDKLIPVYMVMGDEIRQARYIGDNIQFMRVYDV